jgi:hypothetical protein
MVNRGKELMNCISVDYDNHITYQSTSMLVMSQVNKRLIRYIQETGQAKDYDAWEKLQQSRATQ